MLWRWWIYLVACLLVGCAHEVVPTGPEDVPQVPFVIEEIHTGPTRAARRAAESSRAEALDAGTQRPARIPTEPLDEPEMSDLQPWVILRLNDGRRFELSPPNDDGVFDDETLALAREAFTPGRHGESHAVHPRLLLILYQAVRFFEASYLLLTSGFRPDRVTSYHAHGRAIDFRIPAVGFLELAEHLRWYGYVGVGVYPGSESVHLDVRPQSFFWVSYGYQGEEGPEQQILPDQARQADRQALERGEPPPEPLPPEVEHERQLLHQRQWGQGD
jgi:hypothetical protein